MKAPLGERAIADKRALLEHYLRTRPAGEGAIVRHDSVDPPPLSFAQQQMWLHAQIAPNVPVYNEPLTLHRHGALDVQCLERCFEEIIRRHEAWRTTFDIRNGEPVQLVHPPPRFPLSVIDLRHLPANERGEAVSRIALEDARTPFDLARGPLLRARVVRMADQEYRIVLTLHHIIFDGSSTYGVFLPELTALYDAFSNNRPSPLREPGIQYGDFARWQRQYVQTPQFASHLDYWRETLRVPPAPLQLPTDRPRPAMQTFRGGVHPFVLSESLAAALRDLSRRQGNTLFVTMLAAFVTLLARYSGQDEVVVGTVSSGRIRTELEELLGYFLNPLVLRTAVADNPTFDQLLRRLRDVTLNALSHQDVPFELVVRAVQPRRDPSRNPLFQALFSLQPPMPTLPPGWDLTLFDVEVGISKFDLYVEVDDRPTGINGRFVFNTDLFDRSTVERMSRHWVRLLEHVASGPRVRLSQIPLLALDEKQNARSSTRRIRPSNPFIRIQRPDLEQTIATRFEQQAAAHPDRIAVDTGRTRWTYATLEAEANRVAANVPRMPAGRVALLFEQGAQRIAAVLGVLKAGHAYVPLDPTYPPARLTHSLCDSDAQVLLTNDENEELAQRVRGPHCLVINLDRPPVGISVGSPRDSLAGRRPAGPDALAYILYTSGSTGTPKGVPQTHRNALHFFRCYTNELHITEEDRLSLVASYSFDASLMDMFGALLNGACLCPFDIRREGLDSLAAFLVDQRITIYHSTPTVFRSLAEWLPSPGRLGSLRLVVLGGEEVQKRDVELYRRQFPARCLLVNLAGQSESSINLMHFIDRDSEVAGTSVPLGDPVEDTEVMLLDKDGEATDLFGEIGVRSAYVTAGYWQLADEGRNRFVRGEDGLLTFRTGDLARRQADGSLAFAGRRDLQVKVRGVRIELGEVESALRSHPAIREAAVSGADIAGSTHLVAYVVVGHPDPTDRELREFLSARLPDAMLPSIFMRLPALPLTPNRKLDRRALPAPERPEVRASHVEPQTARERALADVWRAILRVSHVGIDDSFFEIGGDSLQAVRLFAAIRDRFGRNLPLATLLRAPTIRNLAAVIDADNESDTPLVLLNPGGTSRPLFLVHPIGGEVLCYAELARLLGPDQPVYALRAVEAIERTQPTIEELASRYVDAVKSVAWRGPYVLGGWSFGGTVAFEMARQLRMRGDEVALLAVVDTAPVHMAPRRSMRRRASDVVRRLPYWIVDHDARYSTAEENLSRIVRKARFLAWRLGRALSATSRVDSGESEANLMKLWFPKERHALVMALHRARRNYVPRPYDGRLLLLRSRALPLTYPEDPAVTWRRVVSGGVDVRIIPGSHTGLLKVPGVRVLAHHLRDCIAAANGDVPDAGREDEDVNDEAMEGSRA